MKKTSLHDVHVDHGARMVDFAGWRMPIQYGSILEEVKTVRERVGLFDLGHMGRVEVVGPDAIALVDRVATNHCERIPVGAIRYALLCREDGNPIDDVLLYREPESVFVVVNAANAEEDLAWMRRHGEGFDADVRDLSAELAMVALQGPASQKVLDRVVSGIDLSDLKYYRFARAAVCGLPDVRVSRTGYTGEDGFELYFAADEAPRVWKELLAAGEDVGIAPIGLGARDTLRLEAGMPLYGHEIDAEHNPIEAGLGFGVALKDEKRGTIGFEALERIRAAPRKRLLGLVTEGPRVPRRGMKLLRGDEEVGYVCSGTVSPTLNANVATAYVRLGSAEPGDALDLDVRGKRQPCTLRELPFYSRKRK